MQRNRPVHVSLHNHTTRLGQLEFFSFSKLH